MLETYPGKELEEYTEYTEKIEDDRGAYHGSCKDISAFRLSVLQRKSVVLLDCDMQGQ